MSDEFQMLNGIPQGSSLSVLLWLIYINDLDDHIEDSTSNLFVDDTLIWASTPSVALTRRSLQLQASRIIHWAKVNKVLINWKKTQFTHAAFHPSDPPLRIGTVVLPPQRSLTYLGVTFNANADFNTLVFELNSVAGDVRRRASVIQRLNKYRFPSKLMQNFVSAFCYSKMRYLTPILGAEIHHPNTLAPLERAARRA